MKVTGGPVLDTGWIVVQVQVNGSADDPSWDYYWDRCSWGTRESAITGGLERLGHDDFNIGFISHGALIWWGWMDEPMLQDMASAAENLGLEVVLPVPDKEQQQ